VRHPYDRTVPQSIASALALAFLLGGCAPPSETESTPAGLPQAASPSLTSSPSAIARSPAPLTTEPSPSPLIAVEDAPEGFLTAEVSCFSITVPDSFTVVDPEDPTTFLDAVADHPEVDQTLATHVATSLALGTAPTFWAWDLGSAAEGDGAARAVNVIVVDEPLLRDLDEYLPEYAAGLVDVYGLDPNSVRAEVIQLSASPTIEATVSTLDGPGGSPYNTTHYIIPDRSRVLVMSMSSRPDWMAAHRDVMHAIAGSIEPVC
jgi:hypothetical protein